MPDPVQVVAEALRCSCTTADAPWHECSQHGIPGSAEHNVIAALTAAGALMPDEADELRQRKERA